MNRSNLYDYHMDAATSHRQVAPQTAGSALGADHGYLLARVGEAAVRRLGHALEPLGLRPVHYAVLLHAETTEGASQRAIVDALAIKASTLVGVIDELERRELAERRAAPQDRRSYAIFVTARGRELLDEAHAIADAVREELLAPLDDAERRALHGMLTRIDAAATLAPSTSAAGDGR